MESKEVIYNKECGYLPQETIEICPVREKDTLVGLIGQYYELLKNGLSYDEIKNMIELDSAIYMKNEVLDIDNNYVIKSLKESKIHFKALKCAKVTLDENLKEKEEKSLKMLNSSK